MYSVTSVYMEGHIGGKLGLVSKLCSFKYLVKIKLIVSLASLWHALLEVCSGYMFWGQSSVWTYSGIGPKTTPSTFSFQYWNNLVYRIIWPMHIKIVFEEESRPPGTLGGALKMGGGEVNNAPYLFQNVTSLSNIKLK